MRCPLCNHHVGNRRRVGPTGRDVFMILIDSCFNCGTMVPVDELPYKENRWVERYNERMKREFEKTMS